MDFEPEPLVHKDGTVNMMILALMPDLAREKKKKKIGKKKIQILFRLCYPRAYLGFLKNIRQIGPVVWPAIANIYI